ncbi:MAG: hypothetical protein IT373_26140 [Polyangiaceae bacterium]|nr:hypothetical protein [Polyangiaceae bacterium]
MDHADEPRDPLPGDELVPPPEEQDRLVAGMAHLMRRLGHEPFVAGPLFQPTAEDFPEPLRATRRSVRELLGRLMSYAGLGALRIDLATFDSAQPFVELRDDGTVVQSPHNTAAWFTGIEGDTARFGVDLQQLDDIEKLAGILCHEVAHAFRSAHGVVVTTRSVEEELTDLTTVYLGFGIFTVNNSYLHRSRRIAGSMMSHEIRRQELGYLGPQRFAFLLAVQLVARGRARAAHGRILGLLEPTQREMAREAMRRLLPRRKTLCLELGLPPEEAWPPLRSCDPNLAPAAPARTEDTAPEDDDEPLVHDGQRPGVNRDRVVFRIKHDHALLGVFVAIVPALFMIGALGPFGAVIPMVIGLVWGAARVRYECSDAECGGRLEGEDVTCPRCGGTVGGTLRNRHERLAAEEAFLAERAADQRAARRRNARSADPPGPAVRSKRPARARKQRPVRKPAPRV